MQPLFPKVLKCYLIDLERWPDNSDYYLFYFLREILDKNSEPDSPFSTFYINYEVAGDHYSVIRAE